MADESYVMRLKARIEEFEIQLAQSVSRREALDIAIKASEISMEAMKIATEPRWKSEIRAKCTAFLDTAENIKSDPNWTPPSARQEALVAGVSPQKHLESSPPIGGLTLEDPRPSPARTAKTLPSRRVASSQLEDPLGPSPTSGPTEALLIPSLATSTLVTKGKSKGNSPIPRSSSIEFKYPLIMSEEIVLLKSSKFHNSTFPPWKEVPSMKLFIQENGKHFTDAHDLALSAHQKETFDGWKRASETSDQTIQGLVAPRQSSMAIPEQYGSIDLVQQAAADCSLVASLCAIAARSDTNLLNILLSKIYPQGPATRSPVLSPNGKYIVQLNFNGCPRQVVIDDRLPVSSSGHLLHVSDRNHPDLLWPALIEKAYLKVQGGYDFPGSNSATDIWVLLGWIPEVKFLQRDDIDTLALWNCLHENFGNGDILLSLGTDQMSTTVELAFGLAEHHNYPVLDVKYVNGVKFLVVKNPWIDGQSWNDVTKTVQKAEPVSPTRPASEARQTGQQVDTDTFAIIPTEGRSADEKSLLSGTFQIKFDDVLQHFNAIYLNWNPALFKSRVDTHFKWDLSQVDDKLSLKTSTSYFADHPQFVFQVADTGRVNIVLTRHFSDHPTESTGGLPNTVGQFGFLGLHVLDGDDGLIYLRGASLNRSLHIDAPHTLLKMNVEAGKNYSLVPSQEGLKSILQYFSLSIFAQHDVKIWPSKSRYANKSVVNSAWTNNSAGGNVNSEKYYTNPQFSLNVSQSGPITLVVRTGSKHLNVHVKLVHGQGQRIHKLRKRDIVIDSGEYQTECAMAQMENLDAGTYTLICSTFGTDELGDFLLRVDSDAECSLRQLPAADAGRIMATLAECSFSQTAEKIACPIVPRRLVRSYFVAKFVRGTEVEQASLSSGSLSRQTSQIRSPIRITIEIGTGSRRRILMSSGGGDYSNDAAGVRTDDLDLEPRMTETNDMWLVIERWPSAKKAGEIYQIEVYPDVPNALAFGVWREWAG